MGISGQWDVETKNTEIIVKTGWVRVRARVRFMIRHPGIGLGWG